jgi:membrane associated rhomboid family serine protease
VAAYGFAFANQSSVQPLIGASGAIAGVLGAYLAIYPRAKAWSLVPFFFFIPVRIPAWLVLGSWFVLQWLYSAGYAASGGGDVAYLAHVFGFLAGLAIGLAGACRHPVEPGGQLGDDLVAVGLVQDLVPGVRVGADGHVGQARGLVALG